MTTERNEFEKRTMIAFILQGVFYFIGFCFYDYNTIIPIFIQSFTGRVELAGVANAISKCASPLFQLLCGSYVIKVKNVSRYISSIMAIGYATPFLVVIALFSGVNGIALAYITFIAVAVMWISDGFIIIGYYDLLGRTVSSTNRGRVLGLQQFIGGAGAMIGAFIVKQILDLQETDLKTKFMIIFSLGGTILLISAFSMSFVRDVPERKPQAAYNLRKQLDKIPGCVKNNRSFRKIMYSQFFFNISMMSAPYILIMCKSQFKLPENVVSTLLNFQVFGTLMGGAVSAFISPRFGSKITVIIYCSLSLVSSAAGLMTILGVGSFILNIFITVTASGLAAASWAGYMNAIIDVSDKGNTHIYMLINSIVTLLLSFSSLVGGYIVKDFGYGALMYVCLSSSIFAILIAISLYREKGGIVNE